jgi:hypothetical protein
VAALPPRVPPLEAPPGPQETGRLEALLGSTTVEAAPALIGEVRVRPELGGVPSVRIVETGADPGADVRAAHAFRGHTAVCTSRGAPSRSITAVV